MLGWLNIKKNWRKKYSFELEHNEIIYVCFFKTAKFRAIVHLYIFIVILMYIV